MMAPTRTLSPTARLAFYRWLVQTGRLNDGVVAPEPEPDAPLAAAPGTDLGQRVIPPAEQVYNLASCLLVQMEAFSGERALAFLPRLRFLRDVAAAHARANCQGCRWTTRHSETSLNER